MLAATFHALVVLALWSVGTVFQQSLVSELNGGPLLSGGFINLPSSPASQNKVPKRREIFSLTQQTTPARQGRLIVFDGGIYILERRKRSVEKSVKNESRGSDEDERGTNASMLRKGIFKGFTIVGLVAAHWLSVVFASGAKTDKDQIKSLHRRSSAVVAGFSGSVMTLVGTLGLLIIIGWPRLEGDNSPPQAPLFLIAVVLALLGFGIGMSQSALVEAVAKAVQRNRRQQLSSTLQTSLQQQEGDDGTDMDGKNYSIQQQWANGDDLERHICKLLMVGVLFPPLFASAIFGRNSVEPRIRFSASLFFILCVQVLLVWPLWRALCHLLLVDDTSDVFSDPIDDEPTEQVDHDQKHNVDEKEDRPSSRVQEGDSHHQEQLQEQVEHRQDRTLTMTTTLTGLISHSSAIFSGGRSVMDISSLPLLSDKDGRRRQDGGFDSTSQVSAPMLVCTDGLKVHRSGGIKTTGGNLRRDLYKRSLHRRRHHQQHYSGGGTFDSQTSAPVGGGSFCTVTKHGSTATIAGLNSRQQHVQSSRESFDGTSLGTAATGTADKSSEAAMQMRVARSAEVVNGTKRSMEVGRMAARQNAQQRLGRADFFDGNDGASLVSAVSAALLAGSRSDTLGVVDCARSFASAPQDGDPDLLLRVGRTFPETGNIIYRKRSVTASTIHHPFSQHLLSRRSIQQHQEALPHDGGDGWTMVVAPDEVIQNADDQIAEQLTQMPPSPQKRFRMSQQPHDSLEPLDDEIAAHNRLRTLLAGPFSFAVALVTEIFFTCALRQHEHGSQDNSRTTFIYSAVVMLMRIGHLLLVPSSNGISSPLTSHNFVLALSIMGSGVSVCFQNLITDKGIGSWIFASLPAAVLAVSFALTTPTIVLFMLEPSKTFCWSMQERRRRSDDALMYSIVSSLRLTLVVQNVAALLAPILFEMIIGMAGGPRVVTVVQLGSVALMAAVFIRFLDLEANSFQNGQRGGVGFGHSPSSSFILRMFIGRDLLPMHHRTRRSIRRLINGVRWSIRRGYRGSLRRSRVFRTGDKEGEGRASIIYSRAERPSSARHLLLDEELCSSRRTTTTSETHTQPPAAVNDQPHKFPLASHRSVCRQMTTVLESPSPGPSSSAAADQPTQLQLLVCPDQLYIQQREWFQNRRFQSTTADQCDAGQHGRRDEETMGLRKTASQPLPPKTEAI